MSGQKGSGASCDVLVLGGGVDGLICATRLAKAGKQVIVVEPREQLGGRAVTTEFHPGFRVSPTLHGWGGLHPEVVRRLDLERHGLELIPEDRGVTTLRPDGTAFQLPADATAAAKACAALSERDGRGYERLSALLERFVAFLRPLLLLQPLPLRRPALGELFGPAWQALRFRRLGEKDMHELLRIAPQCLKDLAEDWFADETLRATIVAPAILGNALGPYAPGGAAQLLLWEACSFGGTLRRGGLPRGGMGGLGQALEKAAQAAGVTLRAGTPIAGIQAEGDAVQGVTLADESVLLARAVVSALGPRTTLAKVGAASWGPNLRRRLGTFRSAGCVGKVHFALERLPELKAGPVELGGRLQLGASLDALERAADDAKYGRVSEAPLLDIAIPSVLDPSLAPEGKHVVSVHVQHVPAALRDGTWDAARDALGERVQALLDEQAPGFADAVLAREVLGPPELEARFGLEGGHVLGGDHALDQLFTNRPTPELGTYQTPLRGLYLTGPATHPGGYLTGISGLNTARRLLKDWKQLAG